MKTRVGIGESNQADPFTAGRESVRSAWYQINSSPIALCMLFVSSRYANHCSAVLSGAKSLIGETPLIGCTTAGEITPSGPHRHSIITLLLKRSEDVTIATGSAVGLESNARQTGHELARLARTAYEQAGGSASRQLFLMFSDGLRGNGMDLLRGVQEILGTGFPIVGGSAGDDRMFSQTFQFHNDRVITDGAVGVLFGGTLAIGIGVRHGWKPLGKPRIVTGVQSSSITTIDHQPAIKIYESYFGADARDLTLNHPDKLTTLYPIGIPADSDEGYIARAAIRVLDNGTLQCNAEVPLGAEAHLMMATRDTAIEAAREAAQQAKERLRGAKALCAIILESAARQQLLGLRITDELQIVRETIGSDTPVVGFYTYGEQSPMLHEHTLGPVTFHNESIVILMLGEP